MQVKLQREELIQYHKDQKAPKLDTPKSSEDCHPLEETQTFEGPFSNLICRNVTAYSGSFFTRQSLLLQPVGHSHHVNCSDSLWREPSEVPARVEQRAGSEPSGEPRVLRYTLLFVRLNTTIQ